MSKLVSYLTHNIYVYSNYFLDVENEESKQVTENGAKMEVTLRFCYCKANFTIQHNLRQPYSNKSYSVRRTKLINYKI